jgi:hypothetical protein
MVRGIRKHLHLRSWPKGKDGIALDWSWEYEPETITEYESALILE